MSAVIGEVKIIGGTLDDSIDIEGSLIEKNKRRPVFCLTKHGRTWEVSSSAAPTDFETAQQFARIVLACYQVQHSYRKQVINIGFKTNVIDAPIPMLTRG